MLNKQEKRKLYCGGCEDNFYNGNNSYGIKECWNLESAKVVMKKEVHIDQVPPWKQKPIKTLSCYHRRRYVYVGPNQEY